MEFDELLITTGVDALVRLVHEKQKIEMDDASSILKIAPETIENWARILEDEGILKIEYRLTRVFLVWITPTQDEIINETKTLEKEKQGIGEQTERFKQQLAKQTNEITDIHESFEQFYSRAYKKIDELEKMVGSLPVGGSTDGIFTQYRTELAGVDKELQETQKEFQKLNNEIKELGIKKHGTSTGLVETLENTIQELHSLEKEINEIKKKTENETPKDIDMPSVKDIKYKFESIKNDFAKIKDRNAKIREDMVNLQESTDILKSVAESIVGHEGEIGKMSAELTSLIEQAEKLAKRSNEIFEKVKHHAEIAERLGESVNVAKGITKRFPDQKKVMNELKDIEQQEAALEEKNRSLEKLLGVAGGRQITAKQLTEIIKKMETKTEKLHNDLETLESTLEDEKGTYLTFQKIKERIIPSLDTYNKKIAEMQDKIDKIKQASEQQKEQLKKESTELKESLKTGKMQGMMRVAEEIKDKKRVLDEIRSSIEELTNTSDNLTKRIRLISREAEILDMRSKDIKHDTIEETKKKEEIVQEMKLSKAEEEEFRNKREELKKLIKTLWEE